MKHGHSERRMAEGLKLLRCRYGTGWNKHGLSANMGRAKRRTKSADLNWSVVTCQRGFSNENYMYHNNGN